MDIFECLHPQCNDSSDKDDSGASDDSDIEVAEHLVAPLDEEDLSVNTWCTKKMQVVAMFPIFGLLLVRVQGGS